MCAATAYLPFQESVKSCWMSQLHTPPLKSCQFPQSITLSASSKSPSPACSHTEAGALEESFVSLFHLNFYTYCCLPYLLPETKRKKYSYTVLVSLSVSLCVCCFSMPHELEDEFY